MPKRIDPPFDVESFMEWGDQFHYNMVLIGKQPNEEFPYLGVPFVVVSAFALEVYFKVLTHIERKLLPLKTHNLLHLFDDLTEPTQKRLDEHWTREHLPTFQRHAQNRNLPAGFPIIQSFRQALQLSADAFVDWRYAPKSKNRGFHLPDVVPHARRIILEQRPDLGMKLQTLKRIDP